MESRLIGGIRVDFGLEVADVLAKIDEFVQAPGSHLLFTPNPMFIMKAQKDPELARVLNSADLAVPDGSGLLFARKYLDGVGKMSRGFLFPLKAFVYGAWIGFSKPEGIRLAGSDLIYDICSHAEKNGLNVFLLGGWEKDRIGRMKAGHGNIAGKAAEKLKALFPELKVVGAISDFSDAESEDARSLRNIKERMKVAGVEHIDILFVGSTTGSQEKWLERNIPKIPAKIGMGVGSTFDIVIGNYKRVPSYMKSSNLEWLYRLVSQPWRIKRIFISFPTFPLFIYKQSLPENS